MELAPIISGLQLTERASSLRLSRWEGEITGKRTREALIALADASAFLDLPASDLPAIEKPDPLERTQIFQRAIEYVHTTVPKLPNFMAKRGTTHFEDQTEVKVNSPGSFVGSDDFYASPDMDPREPKQRTLQVMGRTTTIVTYRDGHEVADARGNNDKRSGAGEDSLTTFGEFGPILSVVVGDAIHSKVVWGHWEQSATGTLAVFGYVVPQEMSHYTVKFRGSGDPQTPAYHGEIAVDPATGTILRLTMVTSELKPPFQAYESSIMVEYGPVEIGDRTYTCPVKGVALSKTPGSSAEGGRVIVIQARTFVNDVSFTGYRLFRGDVRVLP